MQLSDILEENSIKTISQKTKIPEENLENLLGKNFDRLKKVTSLGFISIIEREYNADLSTLREESHAYYSANGEDRGHTLGTPIVQEKRGKSKFFMIVILALLVYATWYFFTQFDKKYLSEMIPFIDEGTIENFMGTSEVKSDVLEDLSIGSVNAKRPLEKTAENNLLAPIEGATAETNTEETTGMTEDSVESASSDTLEVTQTVEDITPDATVKKVVSIVPADRLWFGIVDMQTKQREHFSVSNGSELDVSEKRWLVATSSAPFSLFYFNETKEFNDAIEHYFKMDKNGVEELSKSDYIALGGGHSGSKEFKVLKRVKNV